MTRFADSLGRGFEARAFLTLVDPENPPAGRQLNSLDPLPPSRSKSTESLAKVFASASARSDLSRLAVTESPPSRVKASHADWSD